MNEQKQQPITLGKKISKFINDHTTGIIAFIIYGGFGIFFLWFFFGSQIIAFFSPTPQHKCEAELEKSATNIYCKEDGTQGNRKYDECLAKAPYFAWVIDDYTKFASCERQSYPSKADCVADGKEKTTYSEMGDVSFRTTCNNDGTWTTKASSSDWIDFDLPSNEIPKYSCKNVTSYDYNWENDMYCTAPDGTHFYTSYEGANYYENL